MTHDSLVTAYLDAVAAAARLVDQTNSRMPTARRPCITLGVGGDRVGRKPAIVGLLHREICDPGYLRTGSAHETLAYKAEKAGWDNAKNTATQAVEDTATALLTALMNGPRVAKQAVLHTSIAPTLVLAHLSLDGYKDFEASHAIDLGANTATFRTLANGAMAKPGPKGCPTWKVTTFLRPMPHMAGDGSDDPALTAESLVQGATVEQAVLTVALNGVNALLEPGRLEDIQIWKSLEAHDAREFESFLARTTASMSHA